MCFGNGDIEMNKIKRFILYSEIKPEKVEEYVTLHKNAWPEVMAIISEANMHNYSISIRGTQLFTYYEYTGNDFR
jgi:L-rhamnose mutarotase